MKFSIILKRQDADGLGGDLLEAMGMTRSEHAPTVFTRMLPIHNVEKLGTGDSGWSLPEQHTQMYVEALADYGIRPMRVFQKHDSAAGLTPLHASAWADAEPVSAKMSGPKVTVFYRGASVAHIYKKEGQLLEIDTDNGVTLLPKRARRPISIDTYYNDMMILVMPGWGYPDPEDVYGEVEWGDSGAGIQQVKPQYRGRTSTDPRWVQEFLQDYRGKKPVALFINGKLKIDNIPDDLVAASVEESIQPSAIEAALSLVEEATEALSAKTYDEMMFGKKIEEMNSDELLDALLTMHETFDRYREYEEGISSKEAVTEREIVNALKKMGVKKDLYGRPVAYWR